jgi:phage terminase Nu1 subunit (DNA packaging protein)
MLYRGQECTARPFADARGTGTEWLLDGAVVVIEFTTRAVSAEEVAAQALDAERAETAELAGIQLNADPIKRSKARPIENCKALRASPGVQATHTLRTIIDGVPVRVLVVPEEE